MVSFHILNSTCLPCHVRSILCSYHLSFFGYLPMDSREGQNSSKTLFQWIQERDRIPSKTLYDCDGLKQMFRHLVMPTFDVVIDARFEIVDGMLVSKDGCPIPTDSYGVPRLKLTVSG